MFGEASALFQCAVAGSATRSCIVQQNVFLFFGDAGLAKKFGNCVKKNFLNVFD
jgi:hypothetical protein